MPDAPSLDIIQELVDLAEIAAQREYELEKEGVGRLRAVVLTNEELDVLRHVFDAKHRDVNGISRSAGLSSTTTRRAVARLIRLGLVRDEGDGVLRVTPRFHEIRGEIRELWARHLRYVLAALPAEHQASLVQAAAAIRALSTALGFPRPVAGSDLPH
ncbi:MarR family transcriptional regulator [Nakamurella silvestris]|nr:MarR family transcriptional regulator [Nakamurella silvestris]